MKIDHNSKKWIKEIENLKKSIAYRISIYKGIDFWDIEQICKEEINNYINGYYDGTDLYKYDRVELFNSLSGNCKWYADQMNLLFNDYNKSFAYLYYYAYYAFCSYDEYYSGTQTAECFSRKIEEGRNLENYICSAITVNEWELALKYAYRLPYFEAMIKEDYEKAKEELHKYPDPTKTDELKEVYYLDARYTKNIMLAIINQDEEAFNEELKKRIKKYRRNMVDYTILFDAVSIAMIKFARRRGMNYTFSVAEIPEYFLDMDIRVDKEKYRLLDIPEREN